MEDIKVSIIQNKQFIMLTEVDRICRLHGLSYFLCCGTLLGAIRHGGPIPWDDDLDVGMLRTDYDRFIKLAPQSIKEGLFIQTWESDKSYALPHCKMRDLNTHYTETVSEKSGCIDGISIDILPFDCVPDSKPGRYLHGHVLNCILNAIKIRRNWHLDAENNVNKFRYIAYSAISCLIKPQRLIKLHNSISVCFNRFDKEYISQFAGLEYFRFVEKKRNYQELMEKDFSGKSFFVPVQYDEILRNTYGNYWELPPLSDRKGQPGVKRVVVDNKVI